MEEKLEEAERANEVVGEVNAEIKQSIEEALEEEEAFYNSGSCDKLKTPPNSEVKRIER